MRLGVRGRLVLGATLFAALAIGVALLAGRIVLATQLDAAVQELARGDLDPYLSELRLHPDEAPDPPSPGVLVRIESDADGELVDSLPHDVSEHLRDRRGESVFRVEDDGARWLVVADEIETSTGTVRLWAARDEASVAGALRTVDLLFVVGGLALVALFAVAATGFVRVALRPVEEARRRERRMVSDAAHELRTPVAGLRGQLALLHRRLPPDAELGPAVADAEASAARLGDLADNLLELARLEEEPSPGRATVGELRSAFLAAVDDVRATPAAQGVDLDQSSASEDAADTRVAHLDVVGFGRLVRNLLANAVAATGPAGSVRAALIADGEALRLSVADDGPGMSEQFLPRALERFTRDAPSGAAGGGLGLALVSALVSGARGEIRLRNTHPGFLVEVDLPLF